MSTWEPGAGLRPERDQTGWPGATSSFAHQAIRRANDTYEVATLSPTASARLYHAAVAGESADSDGRQSNAPQGLHCNDEFWERTPTSNYRRKDRFSVREIVNFGTTCVPELLSIPQQKARGEKIMNRARSMAVASIAFCLAVMSGCSDSEKPKILAPAPTIEDPTDQAAAIAKIQQEAEAAADSLDTRTALSRKAEGVLLTMSRAEIIDLLGPPSHVISPPNLKAQGIDRASNIEYVLTWENPECSRVEVFFSRTNQTSGWDRGEVCITQRALPKSYSCEKKANAKYCSKEV